jgi:simple sugar transport system permease protein
MGRIKEFIQKRGFINAASSIIAIIVGLFFGYIILLISNPPQSLEGIGIILKGGFSGGAKGCGQCPLFATPIIMTGRVARLLRSKPGCSLGATGQVTVGAFRRALFGVHWTFTARLSALGGSRCWGRSRTGALWALIPGCSSVLNDERSHLSTIMFNYWACIP